MELSLKWIFDFYKTVPLPGKLSKRISILKCLDKNKNEVTLQHKLTASQNLNVTLAFIRLFVLLHKQNRKINIIEIGTSTGGLTVFLDTFARKFDLDYKLYTYDIVDKVSKNTKQLFCDLDINLEIVDVFSEPGLTKIIKVTSSDAMTVIFCDGGNKAKEIIIFSEMLRVGDVILGHDYGYDDKSFKDQLWEAHELDFNMIKNAYQQHNLRFIHQSTMENAVWFCARKTTDVGKNLQILTVCNEPYRLMMTELLVTLEFFHPEVPVKMLALNLTKESKEHFRNIHSNIDFIDDSYSNFENFEEERAYCESCRTWNMKQLLTDTQSDIFYLDGDVYLKGAIFELFDFFSTVDFCARIKIENPIRFNAGMIYVKNTDENIKIVQQWEDQTRKHGWVWLSAQNELGHVLEEHLTSVTVKTLPEKFDGIDTNEKSVIIHRKGPKDLKQ